MHISIGLSHLDRLHGHDFDTNLPMTARPYLREKVALPTKETEDFRTGRLSDSFEFAQLPEMNEVTPEGILESEVEGTRTGVEHRCEDGSISESHNRLAKGHKWMQMAREI